MKSIDDRELRKYNYAQYEDGTIVCIQNGWEIDEGSELFAIPITEDWLVKLGFLKGQKHIVGDKYTYWNNGLGIDHIIDNRFSIRSEYKTQLVLLVHHVHELQNLFYALFKKELEVK